MLDTLRTTLADGGLIALPAALVGGVIAGLNPCCLPMYPAAAATCCAVREERARSFPAALAFVGGLAVATAILGIVASAAGRTLTAVGGWIPYVVAVIPLAAGAYLLGWLPLPPLRLQPIRARVGGAFLAGLLLSLVIAPCGTPVLASILSYAAYRGSLPYGGLLLFVYGIGMSVPVLLLGVSAAKLAARLDRSGLRRWVDRATGVLLLGMGFYLLWIA